MARLKAYILTVALVLVAAVARAQDINSLRSQNRVVTVDEPTAPYYAIQILAMKNPPTDVTRFSNFSEIREFNCADGYVRYCVGQYNSYADANANLSDVRGKGFADAFIVNTKTFAQGGGGSRRSSSKGRRKEVEIIASHKYVVQLGAFRYPVYISFFEGITPVYEYRMNDKIYRYSTAPVSGSEAESYLAKIVAQGYPNAFLVDYAEFEAFRID